MRKPDVSGAFSPTSTDRLAQQVAWYEKMNSYRYMPIAELAKTIGSLEEGTKIRISGFPQLLESKHKARGTAQGTSIRNRGDYASVDVRVNTYTIHANQDMSDAGVQVVQQRSNETSYAYLVTHFDAPKLEETKLRENDQYLVLGTITKTPNGTSQLRIDEAVPTKQTGFLQKR